MCLLVTPSALRLARGQLASLELPLQRLQRIVE